MATHAPKNQQTVLDLLQELKVTKIWEDVFRIAMALEEEEGDDLVRKVARIKQFSRTGTGL